MPPNQQSDGKKCHHFSNLVEQCGGLGFWIFSFQINVVVKSGGFIANWWNFNHHISNCGGTFTTTYHIQGAGAPAKKKNNVNADGVYIFSGKGPTFSASCKTYEHNFKKGWKSNGTDKKRLV